MRAWVDFLQLHMDDAALDAAVVAELAAVVPPALDAWPELQAVLDMVEVGWSGNAAALSSDSRRALHALAQHSMMAVGRGKDTE